MKSSTSNTSEGRATDQVGSQDSPHYSVGYIPPEELKPKMTIKPPKAKMIRLGRGNGDNGFLDKANIKDGEFLCALAAKVIPQEELEPPANWKTDPEKRIYPDTMMVPSKYIQIVRDMYGVPPREHQATRLKEKRPVNEQQLLIFREEPVIAKEGSTEALNLVDDGKQSSDENVVQAVFADGQKKIELQPETTEEKLQRYYDEVVQFQRYGIETRREVEKLKSENEDLREQLAQVEMNQRTLEPKK